MENNILVTLILYNFHRSEYHVVIVLEVFFSSTTIVSSLQSFHHPLSEFQNYLRTQAGNNTTVNVVICTVDYLLRLQESIMDFYWHYSGKETIDQPGKESFCRAIKVAKQIFRSLTEYIQVGLLLGSFWMNYCRYLNLICAIMINMKMFMKILKNRKEEAK